VTAAETWAAEHGFTQPHIYRNGRGENICDCLDAEPAVTRSGVIHERWTFSDSSSIVLRHVFWEVEQ
jgi:hypothetical protein